MIIGLIKKLVDLVFGQPRVSELEQFLQNKNPQTPQDVEFWIREFDNHKALINRHIAAGDYMRADWIRNNL